MRLWIVRCTNQDKIDHEENYACVVRAEDEHHARQVAASHVAGESGRVWFGKNVEVTQITEDGGEWFILAANKGA